jgi:hypothetical protein
MEPEGSLPCSQEPTTGPYQILPDIKHSLATEFSCNKVAYNLNSLL